jgi:hypothetical protein
MHGLLAIAASGFVLAACTSSDVLKTATPTVPLQFESEPAGAEVKTSGGQTCRTPCALAVPAADFTASFTLNGYQAQTVAVKLLPPEDMRGGEEFTAVSEPRFTPSPVSAEMVKEVRRPVRQKPRVPRPAAAPQPDAQAPAAQQQPAPSAPAASSPSSPWPSTSTPPPASPWPPAANPIR